MKWGLHPCFALRKVNKLATVSIRAGIQIQEARQSPCCANYYCAEKTGPSPGCPHLFFRVLCDVSTLLGVQVIQALGQFDLCVVSVPL